MRKDANLKVKIKKNISQLLIEYILDFKQAHLDFSLREVLCKA